MLAFHKRDGKRAISPGRCGSLAWTISASTYVSRSLSCTVLAFAGLSNRQPSSDVFLKNSDGMQDAKLILHDERDKLPSDWSRDGKYILYMRSTDL